LAQIKHQSIPSKDFPEMISDRNPDAIRRRGERIFCAIRDRKRGYALDYKVISFAYFIEAAIIGAGFFAGYEFANRYAVDAPTGAQQVAALSWLSGWMQPTSNHAWWMAIVATAAMCASEIARIPLVQAVCTTRSFGKKILMTIGVLMMCAVTTKTMSQVLEQMFHPRLRYVQEASLELDRATANLDMVKHEQSSAIAGSDPLNDEVKRIDELLTEKEKTLREMGPPPKQPGCYWVGKKKGNRKRVCPRRPAWVGDVILAEIEELGNKRGEAVAKRDAAMAETASKGDLVAQAELAVTDAAGKHQKAVADSQLHSFTAMIFGKDPVDVSDAEVHWFLRIFVFFPAIMIALASSLLAASAYSRVRGKPEPILLNINRPQLAGQVKAV
jgi:hypothetical protein